MILKQQKIKLIAEAEFGIFLRGRYWNSYRKGTLELSTLILQFFMETHSVPSGSEGLNGRTHDWLSQVTFTEYWQIMNCFRFNVVVFFQIPWQSSEINVWNVWSKFYILQIFEQWGLGNFFPTILCYVTDSTLHSS